MLVRSLRSSTTLVTDKQGDAHAEWYIRTRKACLRDSPSARYRGNDSIPYSAASTFAVSLVTIPKVLVSEIQETKLKQTLSFVICLSTVPPLPGVGLSLANIYTFLSHCPCLPNFFSSLSLFPLSPSLCSPSERQLASVIKISVSSVLSV